MFIIDIADNAVQAALQAANTQSPWRRHHGAQQGAFCHQHRAGWAALEAQHGDHRRPLHRKKSCGKKAQAAGGGKKPLIGESRKLSKQFHVNAVVNAVTIGNSMAYSAMQQSSGSKAAFPHLWGNIPSRLFMPIKQNGELYPDEQARILATIRKYLAGE